VIVGLEYGRENAERDVARLSRELRAAPKRVLPRLSRARDPLAGIEPERDRSRQHSRERGLDRGWER
jgi:hypothetical protein